MLKSFWYENKRFLITCGGGLIAFLICQLIIGSAFLGSAAETQIKCQNKHTQIVRVQAELRALDWGEVRNKEAYEKHEGVLRGNLCQPPVEVKREAADGSLMVQLDEAIDSAWEAARSAAARQRQRVQLPEKLTARDDFGVHPEDKAEQYRSHYADLRNVRDALVMLAGAGMAEISKPVLEEPEYSPVLENTGVYCLYRSVRFQVSGPYESFQRVLEEAQREGEFLQVRVRNLRPRAAADGRALRAELDFVSFRLEELDELETGQTTLKARSQRQRR